MYVYTLHMKDSPSSPAALHTHTHTHCIRASTEKGREREGNKPRQARMQVVFWQRMDGWMNGCRGGVVVVVIVCVVVCVCGCGKVCGWLCCDGPAVSERVGRVITRVSQPFANQYCSKAAQHTHAHTGQPTNQKKRNGTNTVHTT